jgi:nitroreductase
MLKDLVLKNRSYRKFHADRKVSRELLTSFIETAGNTPSSKNYQPLKYILVHENPSTDRVFKCLGWARHLRDWDGPSVKERPPAYIVMLLDKNISSEALIDAGISAQTILLAATEAGLGGCILRTVDRKQLSDYFNLPEHLEIILVIALGYPNQQVVLTTVSGDGNTNYYERDGIHYVPKRKPEALILDTDNLKGR